MSLHQISFQKFPLIIVVLNFLLLFVVIILINFNLKLSRHIKNIYFFKILVNIGLLATLIKKTDYEN